MQQDQSSGSGHNVLPSGSQGRGPSSSNSPIDLNEFPSHLDYSPVGNQDRPIVMEDNTQPNSSSLAFSKTTSYIRRKPFQCKFCTFACPSATNLAIHMRIHTGEKPYKCGICSYASARKQNLFRHMSTVHKVDHVTMGGPPSATCAYPVGVHSSNEERMPIVENVYGNVQDMVLIDGDPVKVLGRDQGTFSALDATSSGSSNLTQGFPCESASATSEENDIVEVVSVTNPTPATEMLTRHYADSSRFVFAGGMPTSTTSSASNTSAPQTAILDLQFDPHKNLQHSPPAEPGQDIISPDGGSVSISKASTQPALYKEPITGALKRKQGRVANHMTLKNILDGPSIIQNKQNSTATLGLSKSLEKLGTEFKLIQNEEDLDEVLEGSQSLGIRVSSSGGSKLPNNTPRSLNGSTIGETSGFTFSANASNNSYCQESTSNSGIGKVITSMIRTNPSSVMSVFHKKSSPSVRMSSSRASNDQQIANSRNPIRRMPDRSRIIHNVSGHQLQKLNENLSHTSTQTVDKEGIRSEGKSCTRPNRNTPVRRYSPVSAVDTDQKFVPNPPYKKLGRTSLTVEVDLTKVLCCTARKWLQSHLIECDVCEINLPNEREEQGCSCCSSRCHRERIWTPEMDETIHGNESYTTENQNWGNHRAGRIFSCDDHQVINLTRTSMHGRDDRYNTETQENDLEEQVAVGMETESEICHSDLNDTNPEDEVQVIDERLFASQDIGEGNPIPSGVTGDASHKSTRQGYCRQKPSNTSHHDPKTSSRVPISASRATPKPPKTGTNVPRNANKPWESAEYVISKSGHFKEIRSVKKIRSEYICDICQKVCFSYSQLQSHQRVHVETKQLFRCALCRYCTLHYKFLKRHIMMKHSSTTKKNTYTNCNICNKSVRLSMATLHMQTVHGIGIEVIKGKISIVNDTRGSTKPSQHQTAEDDIRHVTKQDQFTAEPKEQSGAEKQDADTMETDTISQVTKETPSHETGTNMAATEETSMLSVDTLAIKHELHQD